MIDINVPLSQYLVKFSFSHVYSLKTPLIPDSIWVQDKNSVIIIRKFPLLKQLTR